MAQSGTKATAYVDGDQASCKWENQKGRSGSVELIEPEIEDNAVVIDSIILDPLTPGVAFNIYYTNDLTGSESNEPMTEEQWEQKLWQRVPQSYVTSVKTTYVLPEPITAKFVKIEFSQLQATSVRTRRLPEANRLQALPRLGGASLPRGNLRAVLHRQARGCGLRCARTGIPADPQRSDPGTDLAGTPDPDPDRRSACG